MGEEDTNILDQIHNVIEHWREESTAATAELDALRERVKVLEEACRDARAYFAGCVEAQDAIDKLDAALSAAVKEKR